MISSDIMRGYNDTIILHLLLDHDSYGYEISKEIETRALGSYSIKETTLYSAFTRLEKNGCIASYFGDETFGKRRTYYKITPKGKQLYYEKCNEWRETKKLISLFTIEVKNIDEENKYERED